MSESELGAAREMARCLREIAAGASAGVTEWVLRARGHDPSQAVKVQPRVGHGAGGFLSSGNCPPHV
jgi:hypothetical protein